MPIHWGAFKLAPHDWTDPIDRVKTKAQELGLELLTPKIGEMFTLESKEKDFEHWWEAHIN